MTVTNTPKIIWEYFMMTLGCLIYSAAWTQVFIPNGISCGGITGLCTVLQYGTGFPMSISYAIINILLLLLGFFLIGKTFGIRSIFGLMMIVLFLDVLPLLHLPALILKEKILIPVVASFMESIGIAIILNYGGSSGGTDIIALIINKYWPVSLGRVYMLTDVLIVASMLLVPGKTIDDVMYGYVAVITFSLSLDYIILGRKSSVQLLIFSEKYREIADFINNEIHRGVTALSSVGWFSQTEKKILLVILKKNQMNELTRKVKEIDPHAFISVTSASDVFGEGFEEIKVGLKLHEGKKK